MEIVLFMIKIRRKEKDLDEDREMNGYNYKWIHPNLKETKSKEKLKSPFYIYSKDEIKFEFGIETDNCDIYVILKSLQSDINRISIECDVRFGEMNINISGIVHFKQNALRRKLDTLDILPDFLKQEDSKQLTVLININVIAKYQ